MFAIKSKHNKLSKNLLTECLYVKDLEIFQHNTMIYHNFSKEISPIIYSYPGFATVGLKEIEQNGGYFKHLINDLKY